MANGAESPAGWSFERITEALRVHPNPGVSNTPGKGYSCKSYTHSLAPSHSTPKRSPIPTVTAPGHCPQCEAKEPLTGHGFYCRTLVDLAFDGVIRVRRYLRSADRQSRARQSRPDGTHGQLSVQARFERGHRD